MKKTYLGPILIFGMLFSLLIFPELTMADNSPSASSSASVKEKLQTLEQEIASKASQLKDQINQKLQNRAYVGTVKNINTGSSELIMNALTTGEYQIKWNKFTTTGGKGFTDITTLKPNDFIVSLGDIDENEVMTARKIVKLQATDKKSKDIYLGKVQQVSTKDVHIYTDDKISIDFIFDKYTLVQSGDSKITIKGLNVGDEVSVVGEVSKNNILYADSIYFVKHSTLTLAEQNATASATPTPTKSGPSATASPNK